MGPYGPSDGSRRVRDIGDIPAHPAGRGPARAQAVSPDAGAALCGRSELGAAAAVRAPGAPQSQEEPLFRARRGRLLARAARRAPGRADQRPGRPAASRAPRRRHRPFRLPRRRGRSARCLPLCSRRPRRGCSARGMRRATGPFTLSINDETGLLIDGFDTPPYLMMGHVPRYYGAPGRGAGLPQGARPDRLRLRRRGAAAAARQAHARAPEQGRRPQLSPDRHAPLRSGAADDRRHLQ